MKAMKYLSMLLAVLAMSVCMVSCGDDDEEVSKGNSSIVGTWVLSDWTVNGLKADLTVVFKSDNKGNMTAKYANGTDPDSYNFEYVLNEEVNGDMTLTVIWTGTKYIHYYSGEPYDVIITPNRLMWDDLEYVRQ